MPTIIPFENEKNLLGSSLTFINITPNDFNELSVAIRMLYVGTAGDVAVEDSRGVIAVHKNVPAGAYLGPFTVVRVLSTDTTSTNLVGYV